LASSTPLTDLHEYSRRGNEVKPIFLTCLGGAWAKAKGNVEGGWVARAIRTPLSRVQRMGEAV